MATANETKKANEPKMVTIKIELTRTEKDDVYVCVNGHSFQIKRGEYVEVPDYVVEVLQNKEKMLAEAIAFETQASAGANQ